MNPVVEITALRKSFGANEVLKGIDLKVESGVITWAPRLSRAQTNSCR